VNEVVTANYTGTAGAGASYNWVYTGGTLISGSGAGPLQLSWATAGNANVQLTVTENGCSSATSTQTTTIQAAPIFTISSPAFTGENTSTTITYSGTQPAGASYVWNFNGATVLSGSGAGPYQVQWSTAGTYTVSCTVNLNGCSASAQTSSTQVVSAAIATFTADSPLCPTEVSNVVFTGFALPSASFSWNFDGGTIISGTGPGPFQISWPTSGVKNVTLQVTQLGVSSALMSQLVTVHAIPTATFASTDPYCAGRNITFNYSGSASSSAAYTWNFGSGVLQSSVTGSSYTVEFPTVMTETVTLSVTENGCISVPVSLSVNLQPVPLATFTATSSFCENAPVYLNYTGGASSSSTFSWDFDGATVTSGSASGPFEIHYSGSGNYSIELVVNDSSCPSDTFFVPVTVTPSPTNNFSIASTGCSADSVVVTYTGNATASATYVWDFESAVGYSGSGQGPYSALFPGSGSYPVGLFVMENGCMSAISEVQIPLNASPVATFTLTDTVYVNQVATAVFTGQSPVGSSMTWAYPTANWLNGGAGGPIELNWNSPGTYQVSLAMDNSGCVDGPHVQDVVVLPLPTAAFALSQDSICAGSSVMVTYSGTGTSQALYNWNFDGATIISGSGFGPYELSWPSESVHTVSLSVSVNGISTPAFSEYVTVIGIPVATFNLLDEACAGTSVTASFSSVTTLNAQFQWVTAGADSVDASDPANIQLIWNTPGVRNVILSVADAMCISAPVSHMIHVYEVPQASFVLPEYACLNSDMEVVYTGSVISGASYDWNFGNAGVVGNDAGPYTLNYSTAGTAHITLLVTANGCSSNLVDSTLVIRNLPVAQAGADVLLCAGDTVQLATPFVTGNSYTWFPLGGLNSDTVSNPMISLSSIHNYVESVEYTVTVGDGYCTNTDQVIVQIAPRPTANFVHPDDQCFEGNSFSFIPNGSFTDEATFFWNLGPHAYTHSPADKEQHAVNFETTGPQFVSLSVSQFGCTSDVYVDSVFVHANPTTTFLAHNIKGCVPLESTFEASSSANGSTTYTWNFGDGHSATGDSLSHEYAVSGYMSVSVTATDSNGCIATHSEQNVVQVLEQPVAGFRTSPEIVFIGADDLELTSLSENALYCYYIIGADTILGCTNTYSFTNEGVYPITQVVLNALGCTDEITHTVTVEFGTEYYVPSAFTPNNDGKNDEFKIVGSDVKAFSLIIFDRWGNEIFTSDNISKGWDGIASENQPMPEGVYVYRLEMKSKTNRDILKNGAVTLLR
jgi:gliding motility-associated-like protein